MAYLDENGPSWISILGLAVWLVAGVLSFGLFFDLFASDCISGDCSPSLDVRVIAAISAAFIVGGLATLASVVTVARAASSPRLKISDRTLDSLRQGLRWSFKLLIFGSMAIWLENLITMEWQYANCSYPVFGWPYPNRAFNGVSSLEWDVDVFAYSVDLFIYFIIAAAIFYILKRFFKRWPIIYRLPFALSFAAAPLLLLSMSGWHAKTPSDIITYPISFGFHTGYGSCRKD